MAKKRGDSYSFLPQKHPEVRAKQKAAKGIREFALAPLLPHPPDEDEPVDLTEKEAFVPLHEKAQLAAGPEEEEVEMTEPELNGVLQFR